MKLAVQMYTVRQYTKTEKDIFESLEKIKAMGYNAVQISAFGEYDVHRLKGKLDELLLEVCATHTPLHRLLNDTKNVIDEHKLLGAEYVGLGYYLGGSLDDYKKFLKDLTPAINKIADSGLKFVYHNHAHEFIKYDGTSALEFFRDNTDADKFGFLADFYWIQAAGLSPIKFIEDFSGRLKVVHFKDMRAAKAGENNMAEIFEGNMDYESIYKACLKENVEWAAVEQDECGGNPFDSLKISLSNLKERNMFT